MLAKVTFAAALGMGALPNVVGYPAIGAYMPVTSVLEHSQISLDVTAFNAALKGEDPDYAKAKAIYEKGDGNSCKAPTKARTLQAFAQKDNAGETFYDAFIPTPFPTQFWDTFVLSALDGTGTFAGLSRVKRVTSVKKAVLGLVSYYAAHELEAAIAKAAVDETRDDAGSAHAWDEGWAFYYGADPEGVDSPWEAGKKRDGDFPDGLQVHTEIVPQFNKGLVSVRADTYDAAAAVVARDTIYKMWAVTYLRCALKYLMLAENSYDDKAHAEAYAYYMAIDGWVHSKDATAATTMRNKVEITQASIAAGSYCAAKAALEAAYPAMGLSCDLVGTFSTTITTACSACTSAPVTLPMGSSAVVAVEGSAVDVTCKVEEDLNPNVDGAPRALVGGVAAAIVAGVVAAML